ncbi:MAG: iron ABC transporter permease [Deltaproteobacteria bacterium]|nr:iron ABC transporter permease [Deltaproteobacteria bacterium]
MSTDTALCSMTQPNTLKKTVTISAILTGSLVIVSLISLLEGTTSVGFSDLLSSIFHKIDSNQGSTIIFSYRLPRILLACVVGAGLACSGVVFQGVLRNPLADPYIIGIAAGGALGAVVSISLFKWNGLFSTSIASFVGSLVAVGLVYGLTVLRKNSSYINTVILAGIIVGSMMNSMMLLIMSVTSSHELQRVLFWMMGDFSLADYEKILFSGTVVLIGFLVIYLNANRLNVLSLGEESASNLGIDVQRYRFLLIIVAALMTGSVVSVAGPIGFVGLVAPHSMRLLFGSDHRVLLPTAFLSGALFLVIADTIARLVAYPVELPVGVITALSGAPFFLYLLLKNRN